MINYPEGGGEGGGQQNGSGTSEILPLQKKVGGGGGVLAILNGVGGTRSFSHTGRGHKLCPPFEGGCGAGGGGSQKLYHILNDHNP